MFVTALLFAFKLAAGIVGRSGAMIADAVHSASDFVTDIVVLVFVRISAKPRDDDHHWGHGKYETLASLIIGVALFAVGVELLMDSAEKIKAVANGEVLPRPGAIAVIAAAVSIIFAFNHLVLPVILLKIRHEKGQGDEKYTVHGVAV